MATFLLVHGAWHGGWCWRRVADRLRASGHRVFAPTLTGLGEHCHLLTPQIDLDTHIQDVGNLLRWEDMGDVVLCGHSYGGMVITGVADRYLDRMAALVYLDAMVPKDGEAVTDLLLPGRLEDLRHDVTRNGDGWRLSPVPAARFGVSDPGDQAWVDGKCTSHPWASFEQPLRLRGEHGKIASRTFILAAEYDPSPFQRYAETLRHNPDWKFHALPTGHDVMVTMPGELARLLAEVAA